MYSLWCHHTVAIRAYYDIKGAGPYHTSTLASIHNLKKSKTQISSIDKIEVQCNKATMKRQATKQQQATPTIAYHQYQQGIPRYPTPQLVQKRKKWGEIR